MKRNSVVQAVIRSTKCAYGAWITADGSPWSGERAGWPMVACMASLDEYAAHLGSTVKWTLSKPTNCGEPECPHCEYNGLSHVWNP